MAVSSTDTYSGPYVANGVTVEFPFTFAAVSADDVAVFIRDVSGVDSWVDSLSYTVSLAAEGGAVTFSTAPTGGDLYVVSEPSFLQAVAFASGQAFLPAVVNEVNDRDVVRALYLRDAVRRAPKTPIGGGVAGKFAVVLPDGSWGFSGGGGADDALREDLAQPSGIDLVGGVPARVRENIETLDVTLGDSTDPYTMDAIIKRTGLTPQMMPGFTTGAANHSPYINEAIDRVITAGGGQVWLPPVAGDWKIGTALNMHKTGYTTSNLRVRGVGDKARLRWLNTVGDMIVIGNGVNPVYYATLEDLYLYAGGGARTSGVDFKAKKANIVHLKNIVTDGSYGGIYLEDVNSIYGQMIHINMPNQTSGRGVWCYSDPGGSGRSDIVKFDELTCQAYNAGSYGIVVEGRVAGFHTDGAYMLGTRRGLQMTSASSAFADIPQFCDFNKFETDRALEISVDIENAYRTEFRRCEISNTSGAMDSPYPQGSADNQALYINTGAIDTKIIGGRIGNCREQAVYDNGRGTTIQGTSLTDMAKNTGANFGAIYAGPAADGFLYQDLLIDGYSRAKWATHIETTAKNGRISGVRYQNVVTAYAQGTGVNTTNTGQVQTSYTY